MLQIVSFSLGYHSIGPSALIIGSVTEKCPVRNQNKIGDISEILRGRKITMADYCKLGWRIFQLRKVEIPCERSRTF